MPHDVQAPPQTSGTHAPPGQELIREDTGSPQLIAYRVSTMPPMKLARAPIERRWMEATRDRFANRCLPLLIANQAGWLVLNQVPMRATWAGGWDQRSLTVERLDGLPGEPPGMSHFGEGILTFSMPWMFRTPPGWNLHVRGPANMPKYGVYALEGIVETDWSLATFTMNWFFTAQHTPITFEKDEPICMLTPVRRGDVESFVPIERDIDREPAMKEAYERWSAGRNQFIKDMKQPGTEAHAKRWERHYFQGQAVDGSPAPQHQTRLFVKEFQADPPEGK